MRAFLSLRSRIMVYFSVFLFIAASLGQAVFAEEGKVTSVQARIVDETVIVGEAVSSEGTIRNAGSFPAPLGSYLPMPIPRTPENAGVAVVAPGDQACGL